MSCFVCLYGATVQENLQLFSVEGNEQLVLACDPNDSFGGQASQSQYVCVCVCVCCLPIYSGRRTCGHTSRGHTGGRPHRISHPPSFCGACLNFSREKDSAFLSLVDRDVEFLCTNEAIFLHLLGFFFNEEKSQFV